MTASPGRHVPHLYSEHGTQARETAMSTTHNPLIQPGTAVPLGWKLDPVMRAILLPTLTALLLIAFWEATVRILAIPAVLLPAPSAIADKLVELFFPLILQHAIPTVTESLVAFLISS